MIELSFIIGCLLIVLIGVYLIKANQLFIDEQNRKYIKAINKVKPKVKTKWIHLKKYLTLNIHGFVAVKVANF